VKFNKPIVKGHGKVAQLKSKHSIISIEFYSINHHYYHHSKISLQVPKSPYEGYGIIELVCIQTLT